jgi:putative transposase
MGARMLRDQLRRAGLKVVRSHVTALMHLMGIEALCPQPRTASRHRHRV